MSVDCIRLVWFSCVISVVSGGVESIGCEGCDRFCDLGGVELLWKTFGFLFSVPVAINFCVCLAMSLFQK